MRRFIGLLLLAVVTTIGCSDDDGSGPGATIEGTYTMRTVNGQALPFVLFDQGGFKVEFVSSTLTLQGSTFTELATVRFTDETGVSTDQQTTTGTFSRTGNNITLSTTEEGEVSTLVGTWNGNDQLTFTETSQEFGTFVYVFRK